MAVPPANEADLRDWYERWGWITIDIWVETIIHTIIRSVLSSMS